MVASLIIIRKLISCNSKPQRSRRRPTKNNITMKKIYQQPETLVVRVALERMISESGTVTSIMGTPDIGFGGGSNQAARVKEILDGWEDWEE